MLMPLVLLLIGEIKINIIDTRKITKVKAEQFISNLNVGVYIIGLNKYGISMSNWLRKREIDVVGYIDDYSSESNFNHLPIFSSELDFRNNAIINCVVEGRTLNVELFLKQLNPLTSHDYISLEYTFEEELAPIDFLNDTDSILQNIDDYSYVYRLLEDEQSKDEFESLVNFRLNRDINYLENFEFRINEQYFEDFVVLPKTPTFIDGGGFDGITSLTFMTKYDDYHKIYYFEPTESSMINSKRRLLDYKNINFYQKGLWSSDTTLYFETTHGPANKISDIGDMSINTVSIDKIVSGRIDFIKLDIEGAEIEALKGAKFTIKNDKPKLAVCVYHNQSDFINVPKLVLELNSDYKIYLRHYTQGVFETVMYFV